MNNLDMFLFVLMRDEVVPGKIAEIISQHIEKAKGKEMVFDTLVSKKLFELAQLYTNRILFDS